MKEFIEKLNSDNFSLSFFKKIIKMSKYEDLDYRNEVSNKIIAFHYLHFNNNVKLKELKQEILKNMEKKISKEIIKKLEENFLISDFIDIETKINLLKRINYYAYIKLLILLEKMKKKLLIVLLAMIKTREYEIKEFEKFLEELIIIDRSINQKIFYFSSLNIQKQLENVESFKKLLKQNKEIQYEKN